MAVVPIHAISVGERGVARIKGTRINVSQIARETVALERTLAQIQEDHPHLSLSQIHAALAYYYARKVNKVEIDAEIARRSQQVNKIQASLPAQPSCADSSSVPGRL